MKFEESGHEWEIYKLYVIDLEKWSFWFNEKMCTSYSFSERCFSFATPLRELDWVVLPASYVNTWHMPAEVAKSSSVVNILKWIQHLQGIIWPERPGLSKGVCMYPPCILFVPGKEKDEILLL